ncbi:MAG: hypothetical protein ACYTHJ_16000 [Planctomycetota bacterium]|jgi:hypothetical protein
MTVEVSFAHLNLRFNPFGELPLEDRPSTAIVDVSTILNLLKRPRAAVQFVGDKGYGKTTHLLVIRALLPKSSYVHIPEGETRRVSPGNPTIVDEAQRLTRWQRFRLFRGNRPMVLGTHVDFHDELGRAGRDVETIPVHSTMSARRLHALLSRRIQWARRSPGPVPQIAPATSQRLLAEFGPNVRAIERWLYHHFQSLQEIGNV